MAANTPSRTRQSLVFTFAQELLSDFSLDGPEPDFEKWKDDALSLDLMIAGDNAIYDALSKEEREAWRCLHDALVSVDRVLDLYRSAPVLFRRVTRELSFLPGLLSLHPDNARFNREWVAESGIGQRAAHGEACQHPQHLARQSWPVRYAYAVINTIELTLDTHGENLDLFAEVYGYGVEHPIPVSEYDAVTRRIGWDESRRLQELARMEGQYRVLPRWTKTLKELRRPFNAAHVMHYWRTGKAMIPEEMPDFHMRPEWESYRRRKYAGGPKPGTVQHAIFKDILAALRTIAGCNKRQGLKPRK